MNFSIRAVLYMKSWVFLKYFVNDSSYQILRCEMLFPWPGVRKYWLSMLISFNQYCVVDSLLINNFHELKEVNGRDDRKCLQNIKKYQIIFVRGRFARDNTQFTQGLSTPFDWKCRTSYSSSLILKITICSAFTKKHQ